MQITGRNHLSVEPATAWAAASSVSVPGPPRATCRALGSGSAGPADPDDVGPSVPFPSGPGSSARTSRSPRLNFHSLPGVASRARSRSSCSSLPMCSMHLTSTVPVSAITRAARAGVSLGS